VRIIVLREIAEGLNGQDHASLSDRYGIDALRMTTWPPTKVLRKLSFSTRMRSGFESASMRGISGQWMFSLAWIGTLALGERGKPSVQARGERASCDLLMAPVLPERDHAMPGSHHGLTQKRHN